MITSKWKVHRSLEYYSNQHNHEKSRHWARKSTLLCHLINTAVIAIMPCIWPAVACLESGQNTCPLSFKCVQITERAPKSKPVYTSLRVVLGMMHIFLLKS